MKLRGIPSYIDTTGLTPKQMSMLRLHLERSGYSEGDGSKKQRKIEIARLEQRGYKVNKNCL